MKLARSASVSIHHSQIPEDLPSTTASRSGPSKSGFGHHVFRVAWYGVNTLLFIALLTVLWSAAWEYSTERYLKGFSDAIIPVSAAPAQKVEAILKWMAHTPARFDQAPESMSDDRNPTDTLNYNSLLSVCGTATNAFLNLAYTGGLTARRLLLLDANRTTVHVVAEVFIGGRWVVVDPVFHIIFRGVNGQMLTGDQLANPAIFSAATKDIAGYEPTYVYDRAVHIRLSHLGPLGRWLRETFGVSDWERWPILSLIMERESLEALILFASFALFLVILRAALRWYGEAQLGIRTERVRRKLIRVRRVLFQPAD